MKTETVYVQLNCSERLPKEKGHYFTNEGHLYFSTKGEWFTTSVNSNIVWWLEKREDVIVMTKEEFENERSTAFQDGQNCGGNRCKS